MKKIILLTTTFITLLGLNSCTNKQTEQQSSQKTTYNLKTIELGDITTQESYTASIRGSQEIAIYPQVSGYLKSCRVKEGDNVKKGDILFTIEQAPFLAAYEAAKAGVKVAEANLATADLNYKNTKILFDKAIVSQTDLQMKTNALESAKAALLNAKANANSAKTNLEFTIIKSPVDGVVGKLPYDNGALLSPGVPVSLTIVSDNSNMDVYFSLTENQILSLGEQYGSMDSVVANFPKLKLILNNGSIYKHEGKLASISGVIDRNTGSVSMRAMFPNPQKQLLTGGSGTILIENQNKNVVIIPKTATFEIQNVTFVYKVVDNKAKGTPITIEKNSTDESFIVTKGLTSGDIIIASGAGLVYEGTPINQ